MKLILKFIILYFISALPLGAITAQEVLDNFAKRLNIPVLSGKFKVKLVSKNGDVREITARAFQKNINNVQNNRLFVFDYPPTVKGTSLLLHSFFDGRKNNMWIYLPAVRRVKRIALDSFGGGYFMGSDFTYRDLINNDYNKMDFILEENQNIDGVEYYVIKAWGKTQKIQQENRYSFIRSYYRKNDTFMIRREYFDFNDDLLKVYQVEDFVVLGDYIYPTQISMTNIQTDHKSFLLVEDVNTEDIPDRYFTTRYLKDN